MDNFKKQNDLYDFFKENLQYAVNDIDLDFYAESTDKDAKFYLKDRRKNFFNNIMPRHNLHKYYNSVASSAAFAFNVFGEDEKNFGKGNVINFDNEDFVVREYEKKLDALKSREPAHLDCFISNDDKDVYVETKLTEWIHSPKNLAKTYLEENSYIDIDTYKHFSRYFREFIANPIEYDIEERIMSKFSRYDAMQMLIHSLAIFNKYKGTNKKVELWNLVWDIDDNFSIDVDELESMKPYISMYQEEMQQARIFINYANIMIVPYFKENQIDFKIRYIPFSKFYKNVKYPNDITRNEYLKRYLKIQKNYYKQLAA